MSRWQREEGAILLQVLVCLVALMALAGVVIDQGVMMVARTQAQSAADSGALAGAVAMAMDNDTRESDGPAKTAAYRFATGNNIWGEAPDVVDPAAEGATDVKFYTDDPASFPAECADDSCIRVDVYRNQQRDNPIPIVGLAGVGDQGVRASATARVSEANFSECLKPWLIPDKWIENQAPATEFNLPTSGGGRGGGPALPGDDYVNPGYTPADAGMVVTLKEGNPSTNQPIAPGDFFRIEEADTYRPSISGCVIKKGIGDLVTIRPGNGVGPTNLGVADLLAANDGNPVTVAVGMFDPEAFAQLDRQSGTFDIQIVNIMGFRIESAGPGNQIRGTLVGAVGSFNPNNGVGGGLLTFLRLIR
jgi:hypothetical protein